MKPSAYRTLTVAAVFLCGGILVAGCAKKAVEAPPRLASAPPVAHAAEPPAPAPAPAPATAPAPEVQADGFKDAFFDFDRSDLRADARAALDADAKLLRDHE